MIKIDKKVNLLNKQEKINFLINKIYFLALLQLYNNFYLKFK